MREVSQEDAMSTGTRKQHPKKGPVPQHAQADVLADFATAYRLLDQGELNEYRGQFVAVLSGRVAGAGPNSGKLRDQVSEAHRVDPERIAIIHVLDQTVI
jgi:hypothetical protein